MNKIKGDIAKLRNLSFTGLRGKIFRLCVMLVIIASAAFAVISIHQLTTFSRLVYQTNKSQNETIKKQSQKTLKRLTQESMTNTITLSAEKTDAQFWSMKHDFTMLAEQVQDVLENPGCYAERRVYPPDKANGGKYVLQLIFANDAAANDRQSLSMAYRLANLAPQMREIVRGTDGITRDCYISLPSGVTLEMDKFSDNKFEEDGSLRMYDPKTRPWYKTAVEKGEFCFTLSVSSYYMGSAQIQYGYPIYLDGKLAAVLQGSTEVRKIQEFISDVGIGEGGFSIMVSDEGKLIYSPRESGELEMIDDLSSDIRETGNKELVTLIEDAHKKQQGFEEVTIDGEDYYAAYAMMPTADWLQVTFVPKSELEKPTEELLAEVDAVGEKAEKVYASTFRRSALLILAVIFILVLNAALAAISLSGKILNPIKVMTGHLKNMSGEEFVFEMNDIYRTGDEIEVLADTFGKLSEQSADYLRKILTMTAERERVGTELAIATNIQADMLPNVFPAFPDRSEFDLYASMDPAKEVGGDFYDFILIDDDHLAIIIADVSDKGVPAALFMMSAKIILNYRAQLGGSPGEILTDANKQLCQNNVHKMFVTVWLGILELSTGKLAAANAGHEYPFVRGQDGVFKVFRDKHGLVLGAMEKMKYKDYELQLEPGDAIFVYTDGVPEANKGDNKFYGMERLEKTLNRLSDKDPKGILEGVRSDVDEFAAGARQFDDLTMLCMEYRGKAAEKAVAEAAEEECSGD